MNTHYDQDQIASIYREAKRARRRAARIHTAIVLAIIHSRNTNPRA